MRLRFVLRSSAVGTEIIAALTKVMKSHRLECEAWWERRALSDCGSCAPGCYSTKSRQRLELQRIPWLTTPFESSSNLAGSCWRPSIQKRGVRFALATWREAEDLT